MSNQSLKEIIGGFEDDFRLITNSFIERSPSMRLKEFLQYWKEIHMNCLFANRYDPRELFESITAMNKRLVLILIDEQKYAIADRLVALYFLLCLFEKQPVRLRRKFRLTCQDAIDIQKLCDKIEIQHSHHDAKFAWCHLRHVGAIDFVEERLVYGPSMLMSRRTKPTSNEMDIIHPDPIIESQRDSKEFIQSKIEPAILELETICANYEKIREVLKLDEVSDATVELDSKETLGGLIGQAKNLLNEHNANSS